MKKIAAVLAMLAAGATVSAVPAFSSSGPYGTSSPSDYTANGQGGKTYHPATANEGTGPYGAFAVMVEKPGEVSRQAATPGGSGPFGAIASYGVIQGSGSATAGGKDGCILFAKNCMPDR